VRRERFLTPEDVAKELSVSPLSVRHWLRSGRLKGVKISNLWRIRESEVDRFIAKREQLNQEETAQ
jgi:excisionase family DNA binding protein